VIGNLEPVRHQLIGYAAATNLVAHNRQDKMTASTTEQRPRRSRSRRAPYPNSVLDKKALIESLEDAHLYGSTVQPVHISAFYQALHRQHYPPLPEFVNNYYAHEEAAIQQTHEELRQRENGLVRQQPLKNSVTTRKNRNKMQLPRAFLEFLRTTSALVTVTSTVAQQKTSGDGSTTKLAIRLHDGQLVESVLMRYVSAGTYGYGRASLCVSSQCGCAMGCTVSPWRQVALRLSLELHPRDSLTQLTLSLLALFLLALFRALLCERSQFCATGTMGLSGNLTTGEILEQVVHADRILALQWHDIKNRADGSQRIPKLDLVRNVVFMGMGEVRCAC
jgi:hypothetical protein